MNRFRTIIISVGIAVGLAVGVAVAANGAAVKPDCVNLQYPLCSRSVAERQVVDNSLPARKLLPADRAAFLKDTDTKGSATALFANATPKVIENIGGTFSTRHTEVGNFTLPKGTWLVNLSAKFNRKTASAVGDPEVQPMAQIVGDGQYVTIMGTSISPALDADLTGSAVGLITVTQDTVFTVNAFGYNSARGSQGSGEITAQVGVVVAAA